MNCLTITSLFNHTNVTDRIRTYEHEAMWGKALTSYDLHSSLPEVTRQVGIIEVRLRKLQFIWFLFC